MPKKAAGESGTKKRSRAKGQNSFELVAPTRQVVGEEKGEVKRATVVQENQISRNTVSLSSIPNEEKKDEKIGIKLGASESLAVRQRANSRAFRRNPTALMTAEDYAYVQRDLIRIAILSVLMITATVVLYLLLGR